MIGQRLLEHIGLRRERGVVFAAGGSADIILAKAIARDLVHLGCSSVDLVQPLNCRSLSDKGLLSDNGEFHALLPEHGLDPECVLRHHLSVASERHPDGQRGKGLSISSSLAWHQGSRYVCATYGPGLSLLAGRRDGDDPHYDFAVGVDGGGDVLTHDDNEFDRVVVSEFRSGWTSDRPLLLVAMGLGADGGSAPAEFRGVSPAGWTLLESATIDAAFANSLQRELERLGLWHSDPSSWTAEDPTWGYGFKVPQIIAMAVRSDFPFDGPAAEPDLVMFPRRRQLKVMDRRLLCEARLFLSEGER